MTRHQHSTDPSSPAEPELAAVVAQIPFGMFILAAAYEDASRGTLVRWVQRCANEPLMVMVAMLRGQPVEPLIRDSRAFTLCQIGEGDCFLQRKFAPDEATDDALLSLSSRAAPSGAPILDRAMSYMDCELIRNVELDADHRIYVGQVHHAEILTPDHPAVFFGDINGK